MNDTPEKTPAEDAEPEVSAPEEPAADVSGDDERGDVGPVDEGSVDEETVDVTAIYVRHSRTPTLGFWVVLVVAVGALAGGIIGLVTGSDTVGGVAYFAGSGVLFIGGPLALVAAVVDAVIHRRRR